jgi:hypothetical protein
LILKLLFQRRKTDKKKVRGKKIMTKRNVLVFTLSIAMVLSSFLMAFAGTETQKTAFADMPDNWSTAALNKAVDNDLLKGYEVGDKKLIRAENPLTRAEMAAVVNRAFGATVSSKLKGVTDVSSTAWFAEDMAKAVKMGTFALDTKMRPNDNITRQEAFAVLARAFKATSTDVNHKALDKFLDKANISTWALYDLCGMAEAGYIQGFNGNLQPKANITRAEFAVVMDNLVKQYIDKAGTATEVVAAGNVLVRSAGVTLKDVTVKGDLVIGDGVGEGDAILDNVKVEGRTVVRGGGVNSVIIKGDSNLGKVVLAKTTGEVRVTVEGNAKVEVIIVDDGSDDVIVKGNVGTLEIVGDNVKVTATDATIKEGIISGANVAFVVEKGSSIANVTVSASNAAISGQGEVKTVTIDAGVSNTNITTPNTKIIDNNESPKLPGPVTTSKHLTINGNNIDNLDGKVLNTSLVDLVGEITKHSLYSDNISKFDGLNYDNFKTKFTGKFSPLESVTTSGGIESALKMVAENINTSPNRYKVLEEARTISGDIANVGVTYTDTTIITPKTLKSITVEACGNKCVVYSVYLNDDSKLSEVKVFEDLYDAIKDKTLRQIAQAGPAKITVVINDGTNDITKVYTLKYE